MRKAVITILVLALAAVAGPVAAIEKKILYVDSYNQGYAWSDDISTGIKNVLSGRPDIELKIFRMNTKRHQEEGFNKAAALKAKKLIDTWRPDVVIASDDNASKYLIVPYFRGGTIPFVFCGLNWDASVYGFPATNVTGMIEVALYRPLIDILRKFAGGDRIGYLASDTVSERKEFSNIVKRFKTDFDVRLVSTFSELKRAFVDLQQKTDMVIIQECRSVKGFDHNEMVRLADEKTKVPTGALQKYLRQYALVTVAKIGEEQGEYAARTALEILNGKSPAAIPVVANHKARTWLNMKIARSMGIKFPMDLIENSTLISAGQKKLLYVNSYHRGYAWSDEIEKGFLKALDIKARPDGRFNTSQSTVRLKVFRMDTKIHRSEPFKKHAATAAKAIIDKWRPDIVVTSDDNAAKYLIVPYLKDSAIPFVYCGINWDASPYGLPTKNSTGITEVMPAPDTIAMLRRYAKGDRVGFIGANTLSEHKNIENLTRRLGINFTDGSLVDTFDQWQRVYLKLQNTVDMILWFNPIGIRGWDAGLAEDFVMANSRIPCGGTSDNHVGYTLLGRAKIAEEQGWWAGRAALEILSGTRPADIAPAVGKESRLYLNMKIAKMMGIKFPMELIEQATFVKELQNRGQE